MKLKEFLASRPFQLRVPPPISTEGQELLSDLLIYISDELVKVDDALIWGVDASDLIREVLLDFPEIDDFDLVLSEDGRAEMYVSVGASVYCLETLFMEVDS